MSDEQWREEHNRCPCQGWYEVMTGKDWGCMAAEQGGGMTDGYPEEHELEKIETWDCDDFKGMMDFVASLWYYPDYFEQDGGTYRLSTGGWSGNEEIIGAMKQNSIFWLMCWQMSKRGGHYEFKVR